jgi:glycosyltransferase involved in cell wall biosynthesis
MAHAYYRIRGGEDRYVDEQSELLSKLHEVRLFARQNEELSGSLGATASMFGLRGSKALRDELDDFRPDVVHVHNVYPSLGPIVHREAARRDIPLVMTVHNYRLRCPNGLTFTEGEVCERCVFGTNLNAVVHHCLPSRSQAALYALGVAAHRSIERTEAKVDLFLAPSDFVAERLKRWGVESARVRTVRSFTRPFPGASTAPGEFGLFLGRLVPEKGIDLLLHALRAAGDPPFKVVGEGPSGAELRGLAHSLGLEGTEFLGRLEANELDDLIRRARYVSMPSLWDETGGLAAMEGMAAGRPILVSDRGGLPELVATGGGVSVRAGDVHALAGSIRALTADDDLCAELGAKALAFATEKLTPEAHLRALDEAYRALWGRPGTGRG